MRSAANGRRDKILRRRKKVQAQTIENHRTLEPVPQGPDITGTPLANVVPLLLTTHRRKLSFVPTGGRSTSNTAW